MKKAIGVIVIAAIILGIIFVIYMAFTPSKPDNMVAHITLDGRTITVRVYSYQRISSGWMKIVTDDGNVYQVNERNVVLEEK